MEIGPDGVEQFIFGYQFSRPLDETTQHFEGFRREYDALLSSPQQGIGPIKPKLAKGKLACTHGCAPQRPDLPDPKKKLSQM
jgi:hypothetical protein